MVCQENGINDITILNSFMFMNDEEKDNKL